MADAIAEPPVQTPTAATPPPKTGTDAIVSRMDGIIKPAAPADKPQDKPADKPIDKPADKPADGKKADIQQAKDTVKDPVQLRKRLAEIEKEYGDYKTSKTTEIQGLSAKLKELEGKRYWTQEDEKRHVELESKRKDLEAKLYGYDYRESPEFKEKYVNKGAKLLAKAYKDVESMQVKYVEDGEEKTRKATKSDFARIQSLGESLAEQRQLVKQMFGEDADIVLSHARAIQELEEQANEELNTKRANFDKERTEREGRSKTEQREYETAAQGVDSVLVEKYPQFFGEDAANPEATTALKQGLQFVDEARANFDKLPVAERAQNNAVIRRWAAAFPKLVTLINQKDKLIAEKDELISKLRGTDPGSSGKLEDGSKPAGDKPKGTAGIVAMIGKSA